MKIHCFTHWSLNVMAFLSVCSWTQNQIDLIILLGGYCSSFKFGFFREILLSFFFFPLVDIHTLTLSKPLTNRPNK